MIKLGNFFFRTRNFLFPIFYIFLFLPFPRFSRNYLLVFLIGMIVTLAGQLVRMTTIGLVYIIRGGKNRRIYAEGLVTDGLFSHCRNPMYVGNVLMILGMSIISNSIIAILVLTPLYVLIYQSIITAEEDFLRQKFGNAYEKYYNEVNRWVPNLKGIGATIKSHSFEVKRVLFKEYNTTYLWMFGATLLYMYNYFWFSEEEFSLKSCFQFLIVIAILTSLYLIIRYLKKRKK